MSCESYMILLLVSYDENAFLDYAKQGEKYKYLKRYPKYGWVMHATWGYTCDPRCTWCEVYMENFLQVCEYKHKHGIYMKKGNMQKWGKYKQT